ncbi:MAG: glycine cleavage system protein R [Thiopseudomonas sp.]
MSTPNPREQHLLISAMAHNAPALTLLLCRACQDSRCSIISSRLTQHGDHSALILQAGGSWDALARLESALEQINSRHDVILSWTRSSPDSQTLPALPYIVYVSALHQPDTLTELCQFFTDHGIAMSNIQYDSYLAPQTGALMLTATITVSLPVNTQISWLRDHFLEFSDHLNLDALIEPWRPQSP